MAGRKWWLAASLAGGAALALAACDNGPSAVSHKQAAGAQMASETQTDAYPSRSGRDAGDGAAQPDHRRDPVKLVAGKPMWSSSRKFSAEENAERAFERNGKDFGAADVNAFVQKAHAFVEHPPKGTQTITRRNGDTLFYDPKGNVFAVASKDGAPRTMFKPRDGADYWEQQKAREDDDHRTARRRGKDDEA